MKLTTLDWLIIFTYMLGMIGIGLWAMTKIKDCGGYLLGKRKLGKLMMFAFFFGSGTNSNDPLSVSSASYQQGVSGVWISLAYLFVTPFYWIFPPVFRRARIVTMVDFMRLRYGPIMAAFYNVAMVLHGAIFIGMGVKTAGVVIGVMTGGAMDEFWAQAIIVGLILAYALPGGVVAAYATDIFQSLLIVVLSFLLIPFVASEVGGFEGLHDRVPAAMFALASDNGFSVAWICWFVIGGVFSAAGRSTNAAYGGARNEITARVGVLGNLVKRFCTVGWMLAGLFAIAKYGDSLQNDPDAVFAQLCADVLPAGLRGVMVASILAAVMSTVDGFMITTASILTRNVYQELLVKQATPRHYLAVARISAALVLLLGWYVATSVETLVQFVLIAEQFAALVGVAVFGAIVWRRATHWGAIASLVVMAPLFYYGTMVRQDLPLTQWAPLYLLPGVAAFVIVSLVTRQHDDRQVMELYERMDTPLGEEQRLVDLGIEVDLLEELDDERTVIEEKDHDVSQRLWLLDFLTWPAKVLRGEATWRTYWLDLVGFFGLVAFAIAFLWFVKWLAWLGV